MPTYQADNYIYDPPRPNYGGRKITKLSNGWLITIVHTYNSGTLVFGNRVLKSTDNGVTWTFLTTLLTEGSAPMASNKVAFASRGTKVYYMGGSASVTGSVYRGSFDATTVGTTISSSLTFTTTEVGSVDIVYSSVSDRFHVAIVQRAGTQWGLTYVGFQELNNIVQYTLDFATSGPWYGVAITVNSSGFPVITIGRAAQGTITLWRSTSAAPDQFAFWISGNLGADSAPSPMTGDYMSMARNPINGWLYLSYTDNLSLKVLYSPDNGVTWASGGAGIVHAAGTDLYGVSCTVDAQSRLNVIYVENTPTKYNLWHVVYDPNSITSWSAPRLVKQIPFTNASFYFMIPQMLHEPFVASNPVSFSYFTALSGPSSYITSYEVVNTAPAAPVITYPAANSWINTRIPVITWNFSDPDTGDSQSQYVIELVNSAYNAVIASTGWVSGNVRSWQMPAGWITADGTYYVRMQVKDSTGAISGPGTGTPGDTNYYNVYFGVDTVLPTGAATDAGTRYLNASNKTATFTVSAADNVSLSIVRFAAWGDLGGQNDTVWYDGANNGNGTWSKTINFAAHDGGIDQHYNVHVYAYDVAGNSNIIAIYSVYIDTVSPAAPTQTNGILYATTNSVSWSALSDGPNSSGLLLTTLYLQKWSGSAYVTESGYPKSVVGLSNTITGLTPATQYRWGVTYTDNAGNVSPLAYTNFTTNSYAVTTIENAVAGGKVYNARPKIRMKVIDANDATLTDLEFQRSPIPSFSSPSDVTMSGSPQAFNVAAPFASGTTVTYTPASDLPAGISYIRARANDGKDWGQWSMVTNLTIEIPTYPTTIAANDTTISKRTIDDIRAKVNIVRQARGLAVIVWTDSTVKDWTNGVAGTDIRGIHLIELRQAINDIYVALGASAPTWGVDPIIDTTINRKGQHWIDLRNALALA
jgi:hypothetical protein